MSAAIFGSGAIPGIPTPQLGSASTLLPAVTPTAHIVMVDLAPDSSVRLLETWPVLFRDTFDDNRNSWELERDQTRNNGVQDRSLISDTLVLTLTTYTTSTLFMPANSFVFERPIYYASIDVKKLRWSTNDDRCGLSFNEMSEFEHSTFHFREHGPLAQSYSVVSAHQGGGSNWDIHIERLPAPMIQVGSFNTLGILANGELFTFYINGIPLESRRIPRREGARIDPIVIATSLNHPVVCQFDNFVVHVPSL